MIKKSNWTNEEDSKLLELFRKGKTSSEIGKILNRSKGSVQKRIQKFKNKNEIFEKDRLLKQIENREVIIAIKRESNVFMNNRAIIKACSSAYKNNSRGDLVLDREKAEKERFVYPIDIPGIRINDAIREFDKFEDNNRELDLTEYVKNEMERLKEFQKEVKKGIEEISIKR